MNAKTIEIPSAILRCTANELESLVTKGAASKEVVIALLEQRAAAREARGKKASWPARHVIARLKGEPTPTELREAEKAKAGQQTTKPVKGKAKAEPAPAEPQTESDADKIRRLEDMLAKIKASAAFQAKPATRRRRAK